MEMAVGSHLDYATLRQDGKNPVHSSPFPRHLYFIIFFLSKIALRLQNILK